MLIHAKKSTLMIVVGLAMLAGVYLGVFAGNLEPPGPPAPTKTAVNETDPRIPIRNSDLPLTISSSGSYYLAEDIPVANGNILVNASNVTIDLMGFSLSGGTGDGIDVTSNFVENVTVRNGTVSGWTGRGVDLINADSSLVINVRAEGNGDIGILVGPNGAVIDSTARGNSSHGIFGGGSASISGCNAFLNGNGGIRASQGSTVTSCTARDNIGDGIFTSSSSTITACAAFSNDQDGITAGPGSTVTGCAAGLNVRDGINISGGDSLTVIDCTANQNGDDGIFAGNGSSVIRCTATFNTGDGIEVGTGAFVTGNSCRGNGSGVGDGAGIHATDIDNRIEENNVTNNDRGIDVDLAGNVIIKNSASGNTTDYDIIAGNDVGPVGTAAASTSPWANIQF